MANVQEIPLTADNQRFRLILGGVTYTMQVIWRDAAGWILDVMDFAGTPILMGIPLVPDVNLLAQHPELGINGALAMYCDNGAPEYPTKTNLGYRSHLVFIQE